MLIDLKVYFVFANNDRLSDQNALNLYDFKKSFKTVEEARNYVIDIQNDYSWTKIVNISNYLV